MKYNGINVPSEISPLKLIPGFNNPIEDKVYKYIEDMAETYDIEYTFPPIIGYPIIIEEEDIGKELIIGIECDIGETSNINELGEVTKEDIGEVFFVVTDGFHRSVAAITTGKKYIDVKLDRNSITDIEELKEYDLENNI